MINDSFELKLQMSLYLAQTLVSHVKKESFWNYYRYSPSIHDMHLTFQKSIE